MKFDETLTCQCGLDLVCAKCECSFEILEDGPRDEQWSRQHPIADAKQEKEFRGVACGSSCRSRLLGCVDERNDWIASYVRTRLRTMAGDTFQISRYTVDFVARAVQDRFLSDTDAVLNRILELAALRCLRDGSSTVTQEDVAVALRSLAAQNQ